MDKTKMREMVDELYDILLKLETKEDCQILLEDLCTKKEVEQMAQRVRAARLLSAGNTYVEVIEKTDISSATLSRVSKCLQYGAGYKKFIIPTGDK
jgi:TrpR-related protein YerC/YecD